MSSLIPTTNPLPSPHKKPSKSWRTPDPFTPLSSTHHLICTQQTHTFADSSIFTLSAYEQEPRFPPGNCSWSDGSSSSNSSCDPFPDQLSTHINTIPFHSTVSHLRIGVTTRTAAALLNVISTTTASSANRVGLIMSLTKWRSTFRLPSPLALPLHSTLLSSHLLFHFILHHFLRSFIYLPFAFKEYSNTLSTPERQTYSG